MTCGKQPRSNWVLDTETSIKLRVYPYINNVGFLKSLVAWTIKLVLLLYTLGWARTLPQILKNCSWILTQTIWHKNPSIQHPHFTMLPHLHHNIHPHITITAQQHWWHTAYQCFIVSVLFNWAMVWVVLHPHYWRQLSKENRQVVGEVVKIQPWQQQTKL